MSNAHKTRTIKPEYQNATPWATNLHPDWDKSVDIFPGTVMARITGEYVAPIGVKFGDVTDVSKQEPFGLSALFVAPGFGIDECRDTTNFATWVGDSDALFRVLAPAFDMEADWTNSDDGSKKFVYAGKDGLLTTTVPTETAAVPVGVLIEAKVDQGFIRISLDKSGAPLE